MRFWLTLSVNSEMYFWYWLCYGADVLASMLVADSMYEFELKCYSMKDHFSCWFYL